MNEKELLYQIIRREVHNSLLAINPNLAIFSNIVSNYTISFLEPYIDAFLNSGNGAINQEAAGEFIKEEINSKVDNFLKKFDAEKKNNGSKFVLLA